MFNMFAKSVALASVLSTAIAGSFAPLEARAALPNVTIKALPAGCASYPKYNADTKTAGPWSLNVPAAENPDLVNFGPSTSYSLAIGAQGRPYMRWGHVRIPLSVPDGSDLLTWLPQINLGYRSGIARQAFRCTNDKLEVLADTKVNAAGGPGDAKFTPVTLSPYPYDAGMMYLLEGAQPTLYEHYIGEEKQDGWFLGGFNSTTWGVKWYEADSTSYFLPYFYMRVLPEGQALEANETRIFLKVQV
jgi:hypothetical protein